MSKLTDTLPIIKQLWLDGMTLQAIGDRYGVTKEAIRQHLWEERLFVPKPAKDRVVFKKYLARTDLTEAGRLIVDFCIERNLTLAQAGKLMAIAPQHIQHILKHRAKNVKVAIPALRFVQDRLNSIKEK